MRGHQTVTRPTTTAPKEESEICLVTHIDLPVPLIPLSQYSTFAQL